MRKIRRITLILTIAIAMLCMAGCGDKRPKLSETTMGILDNIVSMRSTWAETTGEKVDWALDGIKVDSIGIETKGGKIYFLYGYTKSGDTYSITGLESVTTSYSAVYGVYQYDNQGEMKKTYGDLSQVQLLTGISYKYNPDWTDEELRGILEEMYMKTLK